VLSSEAANTNFIDSGLTLPGLEPTIRHTGDEHANHCITDAVHLYLWQSPFPAVLDDTERFINKACMFCVLYIGRYKLGVRVLVLNVFSTIF
jgi:hypothetical protein